MDQYLFQHYKERRELLQGVIEKTSSAELMEAGSLVRVTGGIKKPQLYMKSGGEDSDGKYHYVSKKQLKRAGKVMQRDYLLELRETAMNELEFWEKTMELRPALCVEDIYDGMPPLRKRMVSPILIPDEMFVRDWQRQTFQRKEFFEEEKLFPTERGEMVRSKSEVFIANALFRQEIPYHYEVPVRGRGSEVYPDFLVLNPRTRQEFYWEHFGRMDSAGYLERFVRKIALFESVGLYPGINLIVSFEGGGISFGPKMIDMIIRQYLL